MGYRKLKEYDIVDFCYFMFSCRLQNDDPEVVHPECMSKSKKKDEKGVCSPTDCPLCYTAGWGDLLEFDEDIFWEWALEVDSLKGKDREFIKKELIENYDDYDGPDAYGCSWCVQHKEIV